MRTMAKPLILGPLHDIHTPTGSERRHGTIGTGEAGCHNSDREKDHYGNTQLACGSIHREEVVGSRRQDNTLTLRQLRKQNA